MLFGDGNEISEKVKEDILNALNYVNDLLKDGHFIAGEDISIADFAILSTISPFFVMSQIFYINIRFYK